MNRSELIETILTIGTILSFSTGLFYITSNPNPDFLVGIFVLFIVPLSFGILNAIIQENLELQERFI